MEYIETVIIGAGQAGLASSYYLLQEGLEHIVLEKSSKAANNWRGGTWDSFTLITPTWGFRMPGFKQDGLDGGSFMPKAKVIEFFDNYVNDFHLPVKFNTTVVSVEKIDNNGYLVQTNSRTYKSKNVVIAAGFFQKPKIPKYAANISPDILQIHSSRYRNPDKLPEGSVLVVGSGQSGGQIAEELNESGRKVFLCVGRAGRAPRRYRGKDIMEWLEKTGFFNLPPEQLPPGMNKFSGVPHLSGKNGGHAINLHQFFRDGITLLGHLAGVDKNKISLKPDLHENLRLADQFEYQVKNMLDNFIEQSGINAPAEKANNLNYGFEQKIIEEIDLKKENINTIIWATGYSFDYSFIKLPVFDPDGFPVQQRGVTYYPGLYFVGMPWMPSENTGMLLGVAKAAEHIVTKIVEAKKAPAGIA